jgi:EAL domain-containing protein (putative c-di-GMP-specific phosphodiesterase class I)
VRAAGCTVIQGYFVSKPLPIGDFEAWRVGWDGRVPVSLGST